MRRNVRVLIAVFGAVLPAAESARAQSSSLYRAAREEAAARTLPGAAPSDTSLWTIGRKIDAVPAGTRTLQRYSLIAVSEDRARPLQKNDLITIIVREQKKYETQSKSDTEKKWDVNSELSKWFRLYSDPHHILGADKLPYGNPAVKFKWDDKRQNDGELDREDMFVTRITARIVDVLPNGNVVFEARKQEKHDEEEILLTLTGTCRAADISPDNTVQSTQVYDLNLSETHTGSIRDATRRGWIPRFLDLLRPF